jgi:hypothetical protein
VPARASRQSLESETVRRHYETGATGRHHPLPLFLDAKRLRDRVFTKLQGHQRPDQTRDLYLVAARACGLLAWMSGDMSFHGAAETHAWTAWVCAE